MTATGPVRTAAGPIVLVGERPAEDRRHAEHVEHRSAGPQAVDELALAARGQIEARARHRERATESRRAAGAIADLLPRSGLVHAVRRPASSPRSTSCPGASTGSGPEQERVEHGEDGGIGADAEREREDRHGRHDGRALERPRSHSGRPASGVRPRPSPRLPASSRESGATLPKSRFAAARASSARPPRSARSSASSSRWNRISSSSSVSFRFHRSNARTRAARSRNVTGLYSASRSTRAIAIDNCSHFDCSATSCFRPDRVRV